MIIKQVLTIFRYFKKNNTFEVQLKEFLLISHDQVILTDQNGHKLKQEFAE